MINFAENFFGKALKEINEEDLVSFFSESRSETDNIEYKSYPQTAVWETSLNKVLKTTCSFLNASGGLIIWGAPTGSKPEGALEPIFIGDLSPVTVTKDQDWIINKISSSISPMPKDIHVHIVKSGVGRIYLIEIQESQYKPHQFENIYFIRLDGQTKPAPHYIVQALMREIKFPDLRAAIASRAIEKTVNGIYITFNIGIFNFSQFQNEFAISYRVTVENAKFDGWLDIFASVKNMYENNGTVYQQNLFDKTLHYGNPYFDKFNLLIPLKTELVPIVLTFGGRSTPAKCCCYLLKLSWKNNVLDSHKLVVDFENESFSDNQSIEEAIQSFKNM